MTSDGTVGTPPTGFDQNELQNQLHEAVRQLVEGPPAGTDRNELLNQLHEVVQSIDQALMHALENVRVPHGGHFHQVGHPWQELVGIAIGYRHLYGAVGRASAFATTTIRACWMTDEFPTSIGLDIELYGVSLEQRQIPDSMWAILSDRPELPGLVPKQPTPIVWIADRYFAPPKSGSGRARYGSVIRIVDRMGVSADLDWDVDILVSWLAPLATWIGRVLAELDALYKPDKTGRDLTEIGRIFDEVVDEAMAS
jgi:hypothetical protein